MEKRTPDCVLNSCNCKSDSHINSWYTNFMSEAQQILFMQIRLLRMLAEKYALSLKQAAEIFEQYNVLPFIREGYGIFHVEGDEAIFEEVKSYLLSKGAAL